MVIEDSTGRKIKNNKKYNTFLPDNYMNQVYVLPNISINKEGVIVYANEDTSRILGYSKNELLGMEATEIYLNPADRQLLLKELYGKGSIQNFNVTMKRKNGKQVDCKLEMTVFRDSDGMILGHTGIIKDIQLESDLRQRLEKENKRLFSVLEQLPVYVCLYDTNRNVVFANKFLRDRFKKIESKKCYKVFYDADKPCGDCPILRVFESNKPIVYEKTQRDGKTAEIHTYPFIDTDGNRLVLELGIDITERKVTKDKLVELNETLEIMNKILRHDILNDLTVALNFCDLIATEDVDIKDRVMKAISKSVELIENTREFEKAFNGREGSTDAKLFDVKSKLAELTEHYPEININFLGSCRILVDESIMIVFDNIIRNAKVHGKADRIDVALKREGKYCEVSFADNGKGIPDEIKNKLFEEGFGYGLNKGSGLGLYIARKIIKKHGGDITVSDNKPKGTIITLKFKSENVHEIC
ncbi:MAG TPA: PAS domain-containing protein [Candidatus Methanofastidiosum sp.]|nr:PAS domain-containing protein [Methanofastidiosum sp.]